MKKVTPTIKIAEVKSIFDPRQEAISCTLHWLNLPRSVINDRDIVELVNTPVNKKLALRYKKAVESGKLFTNPKIIQSAVPGIKVVKHTGYISIKTLNSDLKKLGF